MSDFSERMIKVYNSIINRINAGIALHNTDSNAHSFGAGYPDKNVVTDENGKIVTEDKITKTSDLINDGDNGIKFVTNDDNRLTNKRDPITHASTTTKYGIGTGNNYGHCMTIDNTEQQIYQEGKALSAYQGKVLKDEINQKVDKETGKGLFSGSYDDLTDKPSYTPNIVSETEDSYKIGTLHLDETPIDIYGKDSDTIYTHPPSKQCNYAYTHPSTQQCIHNHNNNYVSKTQGSENNGKFLKVSGGNVVCEEVDIGNAYVHPSTKQCGYEYIHPNTQQCTHDHNDVYYTEDEVNDLLSNKVDKEDNKGLSEANFTEEEKTKLRGLPTGTQLNMLFDAGFDIEVIRDYNVADLVNDEGGSDGIAFGKYAFHRDLAYGNNTIFFLPATENSVASYYEYILLPGGVNEENEDYPVFELIGTPELDLTNYIQKTDDTNLLLANGDNITQATFAPNIHNHVTSEIIDEEAHLTQAHINQHVNNQFDDLQNQIDTKINISNTENTNLLLANAHEIPQSTFAPNIHTHTSNEITDSAEYLKKSVAETLYQPKGDYLTQHQPLPTIVNDLTIGGTTSVLSAEQGKVLNDNINNLDIQIDNLANSKADNDHTHDDLVTKTDFSNEIGYLDATKLNEDIFFYPLYERVANTTINQGSVHNNHGRRHHDFFIEHDGDIYISLLFKQTNIRDWYGSGISVCTEEPVTETTTVNNNGGSVFTCVGTGDWSCVACGDTRYNNQSSTTCRLRGVNGNIDTYVEFGQYYKFEVLRIGNQYTSIITKMSNATDGFDAKKEVVLYQTKEVEGDYKYWTYYTYEGCTIHYSNVVIKQPSGFFTHLLN